MRYLLTLLLVLAQAVAVAETLTGRVVRVADGDTLFVLDADNIQHEIRLQWIDAPERGQAYSAKSREHLAELVAGKPVVVEYDQHDHYQRILGKVSLDNQDINLEQIRAGLAWHYKKYEREQTTAERVSYSDAEREARKVRRGLWKDPYPLAPWDYRQARREQKKAMEAFETGVESRDRPY
jgi:endonuclease YncB( thermonuclease family)